MNKSDLFLLFTYITLIKLLENNLLLVIALIVVMTLYVVNVRLELTYNRSILERIRATNKPKDKK